MTVSKGRSGTPLEPPWNLPTPPRTLPDPLDPKRTPKEPSRSFGDITKKNASPQAPQEDLQGPLQLAVSIA